MEKNWPYLTADIPPLALTARQTEEDFEVEEIPAYEPCGEGDHVYFRIEKKGISTHEACRRIAKVMNVPAKEIGAAGLKDARAVTRQWLSLEHADPARIQELQIPDLCVLTVTRHRNKLRIGHLKGNRFVLKLRGMEAARLPDFRTVLSRLQEKGVPNYFGAQRFGMRGDTALTGAALMREDYEAAARHIAGYPSESDSGGVREARELFMRGEFEKAATTFPRGYPEAFHLCKMLSRNSGDYKRALFSMDRGMLKFYVSALQSELFNEAVARRIGFLDEVRAGDWAHKHDSGGAFRVDDQAAENPRALRFEISAMGPLFGSEMRPASGEPLRIEEEILKGAGLARGDFEKARPFTCQGDRRPLRFKMEEVSFETGADPTGDYLKLRMVLPSGCYATSVLRELGKDRMNDEARVGKSATA